MNKLLIATISILSFCMSVPSHADTSEALEQALRQFKPQEVLPNYTENPAEINLQQAEGDNPETLKNHGMTQVQNNKDFSDIYNNAQNRTKAINNPNSAEMQYAEHLLEGQELSETQECYTPSPTCESNIVERTCTENNIYQIASCHETLNVMVRAESQTLTRTLMNKGEYATINLAACDKKEPHCDARNLVNVHPHCESLQVTLVMADLLNALNVVSQISCHNLNLTLSTHKIHKKAQLSIYITQKISEDAWDRGMCPALNSKAQDSSCKLVAENACLEANLTKVISDTTITRPCWGVERQYQCFDHLESTCGNFLNDKCHQVGSVCTRAELGSCVTYTQSFSCDEPICTQPPDVCVPKLPCMDGSCDTTQDEVSDDMGLSISRLSALSSVAEEVSTKQVDINTPNIFKGNKTQCVKHLLGTRDCCSDSGWADWMIGCPKSMQDLHKAIEQKRAIYVGDYDGGVFDLNTHHVYCIFPSQIATIIQEQGRLKQLHIPLGNPKDTDCRGITPQELERIDFGALDLSPFEQELKRQFKTPDVSDSLENQINHANRLHQEGKSHD